MTSCGTLFHASRVTLHDDNVKEPVKMRLSLDLSQLPSDIRELQFDPIKVALPEFIIFNETGTDKYIFEDDTLVIRDKYVSTDSKKEYLVELEVNGMDFSKIDAYNAVIRQLEKNKTLRNTIKDESSKENLKKALKALLDELDNAN